MQRDMDLVRRILTEIEGEPESNSWIILDIEGYSADEVSYHVMLMAEANLITAINDNAVDEAQAMGWIPTGLTWDGHQFLDAARDNSRWQRAKTVALQRGGAVSLEVLKSILLTLINQHFKPH